MTQPSHNCLAIIAMEVKLPGISGLDSYWAALKAGDRKSTTFNRKDNSVSARGSNWTNKRGLLEDTEAFDASFFKLSPKEAALIDPQQRLSLQAAWNVLEKSGYGQKTQTNTIGIWVAANRSLYFRENLLKNSTLFHQGGFLQAIIGNGNDYLAPRLAYSLGTTGPAVSINANEAGSAIAISQAFTSIMQNECDIAIAGGVYLPMPQEQSSFLERPASRDWQYDHHPFDALPASCIEGHGLGIVVLKRLDKALNDGDHIHAIISGAAVTNAGAQESPCAVAGGQAIKMAHAIAGTSTEDISYIEAHGRGRTHCDKIELKTLASTYTKALYPRYLGTHSIIGGHLGPASGAAGIIKLALALENSCMPPLSGHEAMPDSIQDLNVAFAVNTHPIAWNAGAVPRRAALNSYASCGSHVHIIVEEAPTPIKTSSLSGKDRVVLLSAKTTDSLLSHTKQLASYLVNSPINSIDDVAFTLRNRNLFTHRVSVCSNSIEDTATQLLALTSNQTSIAHDSPQLVFLFPGQGSQQAGMCAALYKTHAAFKSIFDRCANTLEPLLKKDIRQLVFVDSLANPNLLNETSMTQPVLFSIEIALVNLLKDWGLTPTAMMGHSLGEYTAACVAGVFSIEEACTLVYHRGRLMQAQPRGAMLAVKLPAEKVATYLEGDTVIAGYNAPELNVIAGTHEAIKALSEKLTTAEVGFRPLATSHAFHSPMMNGALPEFKTILDGLTLKKPNKQWISCVTGDWINEDHVITSEYWIEQLRQPVRFSDGISLFSENAASCFLEVGPGKALSVLARQFQTYSNKALPVITALPTEPTDDMINLKKASGKLWSLGFEPEWAKIEETSAGRQISLPAYSFDKTRCWVEPAQRQNSTNITADVEQPTPKEITNEPNATLETIRMLWQDVLGYPHIADADNFFDLGGHSLAASEAINAIQVKFKQKIPLDLIIRSANLSTFCSELDELLINDKEELIERTDTELQALNAKHWSLTPQQKRLWFLFNLSQGEPTYNLAQTVLFEGNVNLHKLQIAVEYVLSIHEAFNTLYTVGSTGEVACYKRTVPLKAQVEYVSGDTNEEKECNFSQIIINENRKVKNFSTNASLAAIYSLGKNRTAVVVYISHIISDGISFNIFYNHLHQSYQNALRDLPLGQNIEVPFQYSDYSFWLQNSPQSDNPKSANFWKNYLAGVPDLIQLPTTFPRPREMSSKGAALKFSLSKDQSVQVTEFCKKLKITPFIFFLSQLYLVLWKYSAQETIVIGAPFSNRPHKDLKNIIGFFVAMIPIRGDINAQNCFLDWVVTISKSFSQAWDNYDIGIDKIIELSEVKRHPNAAPLFQVGFTYQSYLDNDLIGDNYILKQVVVDRGVSENDIALYMWKEEQFQGIFEFSTDLFSLEDIQKLQRHFCNTLSWVLREPNTSLEKLSIIDETDVAAVSAFNNTKDESCIGKTFGGIFNDAQQKYSALPALKYKNETLTYKQLNDATNQLAAILIQQGVKCGDNVGVYLTRGLNTVIALVSVFKTGGIYIPLDPDFPIDRLQHILDDSKPHALIVDAVTASSSLIQDTQATVINTTLSVTRQNLDHFEWPSVNASYIAYTLYTSGSTGKPKGVPISHGAFANILLYASKLHSIDQTDNVLAITTTTFDASFFELLLPLINGACIVVIDSLSAKNGQIMADIIAKEEITFMQATPVTWTLLLDTGWQGRHPFKMLSGGEALKAELANRLLKAGDELWNGYGPTECAICTSWEKVSLENKEPSLGFPVANTQYYVLDEYNNILPPGITGELAIAGEQLSPGYCNRDDLTLKTFIDLNFPGQSKTIRAYKTGDLVKLKHDGSYSYSGRKDFQVKIRGYRIELGEIESRLIEHELIEESCCTVYEHPNHGKSLVAYYSSPLPIHAKELRSFLSAALPNYMIPSIFYHLEEFPNTANEKIDRKSLPDPLKFVDSASTAETMDLSLLTDTEQKLIAIWVDILQTDDIATNDDFFALGGNSLTAAALINEINSSFKTQLKLGEIFQNPTLSLLAKAIDDGGGKVSSLIVRLNQIKNKTPIFFVCGIALYQNLALNLGDNYSCFGVYIPEEESFIHSESQTASMEQLATLYVEAIRKHQPDGPVILAGVSFGGLLAFEVALQLGADAKQLILLDTILPGSYSRRWLSYLMLKPADNIKKATFRAFNFAKEKLKTKKIKSKQLHQQQAVRRDNGLARALKGQATLEYLKSTHRYSGDAMLIIANERPNQEYFKFKPDLGWGKHVSSAISIKTVAGDHLGILDSKETAAAIANFIAIPSP